MGLILSPLVSLSLLSRFTWPGIEDPFFPHMFGNSIMYIERVREGVNMACQYLLTSEINSPAFKRLRISKGREDQNSWVCGVCQTD